MKFSLDFVSAGRDYTSLEKPVAAPYIVKDFNIEKKPERAEITICGLGFYDLYVNGEKITKGYLAPYISNPDHLLYYDNYDLTELLTEGDNTIGLMLGNGMINNPGGFIWDFDKARTRGVPRFAMSFESDRLNFEADQSFLWYPSPILFDDFRCGVHYDARKEIKDWSKPSCDRSHWNPVTEAETPKGTCRLCEAEPIKLQKEIRPVSITKSELADYCEGPQIAGKYPDIDGVFYHSESKEGYLYDFGINTAGVFRLVVKGTPGQKIEIQAAEYINKDGKVDINNIGHFCPQAMGHREVFYCSGEVDTFVLPFTYHGCRYYHVMGLNPEQATEDLLTYMVINSDLPQKGGFSCSDDVVNSIQAMTLNSDMANFFYFPTDCPQREKNGWTGDAALSAEQMTLNYDTKNSFTEWMRNISKALSDEGRLPGIVPTFDWGYDWGNGPAWDVVLTELPYQVHIHTGDRKIIEENAFAIWRYLNYITTTMDDRGLVEYGLGDWCPPDRPADAYKSPLVLTDSIMSMYIAQTAAYLFGQIGWTSQQRYALELADDLRTAIRENLIDFATMMAAGNCLTSQAMAIYYDVFGPSEKAAASQALVNLIHQCGDVMDVGILGARTIFHVLSDCGESDLAYKMITRPDGPSYGNQVARGRTALPETFNVDEEVGFSLNHHFFGDVSAWFIKRIAGIIVNPYKRSAKEVNIKPSFIEGLDYANGFFETVIGKVAVSWERKADGIVLKVDAAEGIEGQVMLPVGYVFECDDPRIDGLSETGLQNIIAMEQGIVIRMII